MKNKKIIIIGVIILLIVIVGIAAGFLLIGNNKIASTITLDINPSIEINLTKEETIYSVVPLNDDAKDIVDNDLQGKSLDDALKTITENLIEKGYTEENNIVILLYTKGEINNEELQNKIRHTFGEKDINTDIINIDNITKEDEDLAKKYNITPAKAAYLKSLTKENDQLSLESLVEKPLKELEETKRTGNYCDEGYTLEGDFCLKEIERVKATPGEVCPRGYYEEKGKCYEEAAVIETGEYECREEFKLDGKKCIRTVEMNATPAKYSCPSGESKTRAELGLTDKNAGDANDIVCVDPSSITHPVSPCEANDGTEYTVSGGKCYWHRAPVIESGCPGKVQVGGECWDDATGIYICRGDRDGDRYNNTNAICKNTLKYSNPTVTEYKCEDNRAKLNGNKCTFDETEDPRNVYACPEGYTKLENDTCINMKNTKEKEDGYVCDQENSKPQGDTCIIYDIVDAYRR